MEKLEMIEKLARLLRQAKCIAVLTGAGMSTESGIPDYRSTDGLYRTLTSEEVFDIYRFEHNPADFYDVIGPLYCSIVEAQPNAGHLALHELEARCGKTVCVATQNIDGLHQKAESRIVCEVHGTMATLTCLKCGRHYESGQFLPLFKEGKTLHCEACDGILKPDITFYGESLPQKAFMDAYNAFRHCDLALVLGTSLVVYPAASLPMERATGTPLAIVNRSATSADREAALVIHEGIGDVLPAAVSLIPDADA